MIFTPEARAQLDDIEASLGKSERAGPASAFRFIQAIFDFCVSLADSPYIGTRRDDIRPGLRTVGYKKRVTVLFASHRVGERVEIVGIFYGGQDYEAAFRDDD